MNKISALILCATALSAQYTPTRNSATELGLPAISVNGYRVGEALCAAVGTSTFTVSSGTGTLWLAVGSDCAVKVRHNIVGACSANCTAVASATSFEPTDLPLYQWEVISGALAATGTVKLTQYESRPLVAGTNVSFGHSAGVTTINGSAAFDPLDLSVGWVRDEFMHGTNSDASVAIHGQLGWQKLPSGAVAAYNATNLGTRHVGIQRLTSASSSYGTIDLEKDAVPIDNPFGIAGWEMKFVFRVPVLSGATAKAGVYGTSAASIANYVGVNYSNGTDTNWQCIMRAASGTEFKADTGVVVSASTWVVLRLRSIVAGTVRCSVAVDDGAGGALGSFSAEKTICASGCDIAQTVPAVDMTPFFYVFHASSTVSMDIDKFFISWTGL